MFTNDEKVEILNVKSRVTDYLDHLGVFRMVNNLNNVVLAGGAFTSILNDDIPNDYDMFILNTDRGLYDNIRANLLDWTTKTKEDIRYIKNPNVVEVSTNPRTSLQLILTDHSTRQDLINSFDYLHCCVNMEFDKTLPNTLYISESVYRSIKNKFLIPNGNNAPKQYRKYKFVNRGWKVHG